jgi:hypothetical protein
MARSGQRREGANHRSKEHQMSSLIKSGLSALAIGFGLATASVTAQATGLPVTLPTTNINANAVFSFSAGSDLLMNRMGVDVSGLGNAKAVGDSGLAFNMPVTEVSVLASIFPPNLTPTAGKATGSALGFQGENGGFALANFSLDFKRNVLVADFMTGSSVTKNFDVFNFHVADGLQISTNGGLSLNMSLDQMKLTTAARDRFVSSLGLDDFVIPVLTNLDFGTLAIDIKPSLRFGVSDKAYAASSMVPEAPQVAMMLLGFIGLAAVSHRRGGNR